MWNSRTLAPPPTCELKVQLTPACKEALNVARFCATKAYKPLQEHLQLLESELYVAKRVIYKLSNQFRSDRALKSLRQVHCCLKRLKVLNLLKQISEFQESVGRISLGDDASIYLPSCQYFEYQLVRLQGVSALLRRTANLSQQTFLYVREHLEIGNMISQNVVMLALCSRIWFVCNSLCLYVCEWYGKFYNCLDHLKPTSIPWLPDGEVIPLDITQWLTDMFGVQCLADEDSEFVKQITSSNEIVMSDTVDVGNESLSSVTTTHNEDIGEVVSRRIVRKVITETCDRQFATKEKVSNRKRKAGNNLLDNGEENRDEAKVSKVENEEKTDKGDNTEPVDLKFGRKMENLDKTSDSNGAVVSQSVPDLETAVTYIVQSVGDVDKVLEQIKTGFLATSKGVFRLTKDKMSQLVQAIVKIKRKMKGNVTTFMGQQMYVKKVKECLIRMLSSVEMRLESDVTGRSDTTLLCQTDNAPTSSMPEVTNVTEMKKKLQSHTELVDNVRHMNTFGSYPSSAGQKKSKKQKKKKKKKASH